MPTGSGIAERGRIDRERRAAASHGAPPLELLHRSTVKWTRVERQEIFERHTAIIAGGMLRPLRPSMR
jgi:hypothetical protein